VLNFIVIFYVRVLQNLCKKTRLIVNIISYLLSSPNLWICDAWKHLYFICSITRRIMSAFHHVSLHRSCRLHLRSLSISIYAVLFSTFTSAITGLVHHD